MGCGIIAYGGPMRDVQHSLHTALPTNIDATPELLAELAIQSVKGCAGKHHLDGISYLAEMRRLGIETPLSTAYEAEVLRRLNASSLAQAWEKARVPG